MSETRPPAPRPASSPSTEPLHRAWPVGRRRGGKYSVPPATKRLVGRRVAQQRAMHGWSQAEFARQARLPSQQISAIEGGKLGISLGHLCHLAAVCQVEPWWFLYGDDAHDAPYRAGYDPAGEEGDDALPTD